MMRMRMPRQGSTGFYNEFWFEYGRDTNRTSLVIERPDGKLPALTPGASEEQQALSARRQEFYQAPSRYLDLNPFDRCITRGLPGAMMPGFYNHNYHMRGTTLPNMLRGARAAEHDARQD